MDSNAILLMKSLLLSLTLEEKTTCKLAINMFLPLNI
ncbi:hypothetical protein NC651_033106 [Populus alba x Populus x berolinensis]|nr:hypothetical protein NC651_033106 [Populus alba x Populus x berolinensis]